LTTCYSTNRSGRLTPVLLAIAAIAFAGCGDREGLSEINWELAWQDEFNGPAGQSPDSTKWKFDVGVDWGNEQLEYDTNRPKNVALDGNGNLSITAHKENYVENNVQRDYTSGRINTWGFFAQERGRFEARIRLPVGQGIWPAFWLLGNNFDQVGWPRCGEIDIMEYRGQEPNKLIGSLHGPGYSGGDALTGSYVHPGAPLNNDFHVLGVEWDANRITWTLDGTRFQAITAENVPSGSAWVFDHPFFIILNVAVGGRFVGPPDATTVFPQTMLVDWVRVYKIQ